MKSENIYQENFQKNHLKKNSNIVETYQNYIDVVLSIALTHIKEKKYENAFNLIKDKLKDNNKQNPNILSRIALFYKKCQRYDEAIKNYQEVLKIYENQLGDQSNEYHVTLQAIEAIEKEKKELL